MKRGTRKPDKLDISERFPLIDTALHKPPKADLIAISLAIAKWAGEMQQADRAGFIRDEELAKLRGKS